MEYPNWLIKVTLITRILLGIIIAGIIILLLLAIPMGLDVLYLFLYLSSGIYLVISLLFVFGLIEIISKSSFRKETEKPASIETEASVEPTQKKI